MPLSSEHKQRSRRKILKSAVKLFTGQGFDNTSIDQVMNHANMTRGAFYAHFSSKSELYREAILYAASSSALAQLRPEGEDGSAWIAALLRVYLSMDHVQQKGSVCPLAFLATDVAVREPAVRSTYTRVFTNMNKLIADNINADAGYDERDILAAMAMMIGGVAIGRALNDSKTTEKLLEACKAAAQTLLSCG